MYFSPLVPIPHLNYLGKSNICLALSHLVSDGNNYYTEFYRNLSKLGAYVILDSGAFEAWLKNSPLPTLDMTLKRAELVGAHEIQFLEKFWNGRGTVEMVISWLRGLGKKELEKYCWQAIVQGKDWEDYVYCFDQLAALEEVEVLGIPIIFTSACYSNAFNVNNLLGTRVLAITELVKRTDKPLHLAGLENPQEVLLACDLGSRVRSADSALPVNHAICGISYLDNITDYPRDVPRFDFFKELPDEILERAFQNICTIRKWCKEPTNNEIYHKLT